MKKMILFAMAALLCAGVSQAQNTGTGNRNQTLQEAKESRKTRKEARKAAEAAYDEMMYEQALQAVKEQNFILEATRVEFRRGFFQDVSPVVNFISMKGDEATVQLVLNQGMSRLPDPNGLGGITVEGRASQVKMDTNKNGDLHFSMLVQGAVLSANISFTLVKGSNKCSVTVDPIFSGNRVTFVGELFPPEQSHVYKGRSL